MYQLIEEASKVLRTPPLVFDFENRTDAVIELRYRGLDVDGNGIVSARGANYEK